MPETTLDPLQTTLDPPEETIDSPVLEPGASEATRELTPEELSTDPVLRWTETDPGIGDVFGLQSVADGRVLARTWDDGGKVIVTSNGSDWTELPMPPGLEPRYVSIFGDRWLVSGTNPRFVTHYGLVTLFGEPVPVGGRIPPSEHVTTRIPPGETIAERVFYSDDQGISWTELVFDIPAAATQAPPCVDPFLVYWYPEFGEPHYRLQDLLDQGWPQCSLISSAVTSLLTTGEHIVVTDLRIADPFDPKGLTRVFTSDGSTVELTAEYEGWSRGAESTADGFLVAVGKALIGSPDGRGWSEIPMEAADETLRFIAGADADDTIWSAHELVGVGSVVKSFSYGTDPSTVATLKGLSIREMVVGSAGLVATANGWVGWPVDGVKWEWQRAADAFGATGCCHGNVQLAVGEDFVLANVRVLGEPGRWFIASVP